MFTTSRGRTIFLITTALLRQHFPAVYPVPTWKKGETQRCARRGDDLAHVPLACRDSDHQNIEPCRPFLSMYEGKCPPVRTARNLQLGVDGYLRWDRLHWYREGFCLRAPDDDYEIISISYLHKLAMLAWKRSRWGQEPLKVYSVLDRMKGQT